MATQDGQKGSKCVKLAPDLAENPGAPCDSPVGCAPHGVIPSCASLAAPATKLARRVLMFFFVHPQLLFIRSGHQDNEPFIPSTRMIVIRVKRLYGDIGNRPSVGTVPPGEKLQAILV